MHEQRAHSLLPNIRRQILVYPVEDLALVNCLQSLKSRRSSDSGDLFIIRIAAKSENPAGFRYWSGGIATYLQLEVAMSQYSAYVLTSSRLLQCCNVVEG